jgi:hypothetical protein
MHEWSNLAQCLGGFKKLMRNQEPVAQAYNPSYLAGRDQEDWGLKPSQANTLQDPISKNIQQKKGWWSGVVGCLPSKCETLSSNPIIEKKEANEEAPSGEPVPTTTRRCQVHEDF